MKLLVNIVQNLIHKNNRDRDEKGLSILELVVSVSIILIITGSSVGVYNGIRSNAKHATVEKAASDVLRAAMLYESDGLDEPKPSYASEQWMKSQKGGVNGDIEVKLEREDVGGEIVVTASYKDGSKISSSRSVNPNGSTCIDGILVGGKNTGDACATGVKDPEIPGPAIGDTVSRLTYKCDAKTDGYLALSGIVPGTKITMAGSDGSNKLVKYSQKTYRELFDALTTRRNDVITDKVSMKPGVKYSIIVNGQFNKLLTPIEIEQDRTKDTTLASCLTDVNKLGNDSNVTELSGFGREKLNSVPETIPKTVESLRNGFREATNFNSPNVRNWNVSNVTNLYYTFGMTKAFNQNLNDWNVSNVTEMYALFYSNQVFNQPLDKWNTGKVKRMQSMFTSDFEFDQDLSSWDTSNVYQMSSMFYRTKKFNSDLSEWDTGKVTHMTNMFFEASAFNSDLSKWNVDNVVEKGGFNDGGIVPSSKLPKFK